MFVLFLLSIIYELYLISISMLIMYLFENIIHDESSSIILSIISILLYIHLIISIIILYDSYIDLFIISYFLPSFITSFSVYVSFYVSITLIHMSILNDPIIIVMN